MFNVGYFLSLYIHNFKKKSKKMNICGVVIIILLYLSGDKRWHSFGI